MCIYIYIHLSLFICMFWESRSVCSMSLRHHHQEHPKHNLSLPYNGDCYKLFSLTDESICKSALEQRRKTDPCNVQARQEQTMLRVHKQYENNNICAVAKNPARSPNQTNPAYRIRISYQSISELPVSFSYMKNMYIEMHTLKDIKHRHTHTHTLATRQQSSP